MNVYKFLETGAAWLTLLFLRLDLPFSYLFRELSFSFSILFSRGSGKCVIFFLRLFASFAFAGVFVVFVDVLGAFHLSVYEH